MRQISVGLAVLVLLMAVSINGADETPRLTVVAHEVSVKDLGDKWQDFVKKAKGRFEDRVRQDNSVSLNTFLNDVLLTLAEDAKSGKLEGIKKYTYWLALYKELDTVNDRLWLPEYVQSFEFNNSRAIADLRKDFSWDKLCAIVKEKVKEKEKK
jgi:hypothetical protein